MPKPIRVPKVKPSKPKPEPQTINGDPVVLRAALSQTLATMPDEAFGWLIAMWATGDQPWGSGLGGFQPDSRAAIENLRQLSKEYLASLRGLVEPL